MKTVVNTMLDPTRRSNDAREFENALRRRIVGQDQAVEKVVEIYQMFLAGLNPPGRPVGNLLFLGPTGSGKTRVVEAMAEALFGDSRACIKIDCAEFQHSHEIAKLIGSPPGYLGHRETHPLLTQEALNQWHTESLKLSILLFDEIEKASDSLWQLLLGILDKATLTLGDNRRVDLSQCIIIMTSNLGAGEMSNLVDGGLGFARKATQVDTTFDEKINRTAVEAARRKFSPEFMNRIDKSVVFRTLRAEHLQQILEIELGMVQQRILTASAMNQFVFSCTAKVKSFLLHEGTDPKYGARHLKRAIERHIVFQLANLVATGQVKVGDFIRVDLSPEGKLLFIKEAENAMVPMLLERHGAAAGAPPLTRSARTAVRREFGATGTLDSK
jgi:ATP-dependent Clp protease ATP-binding subunit ClpB